MKKKQPAASSTARFIVLSDDETEAMMKAAKQCADGECSVDQISDLAKELKDQQGEMEERLKKVKAMIEKLEHLNEKAERKPDEVRNFVRDMLRVFSHEVCYPEYLVVKGADYCYCVQGKERSHHFCYILLSFPYRNKGSKLLDTLVTLVMVPRLLMMPFLPSHGRTPARNRLVACV